MKCFLEYKDELKIELNESRTRTRLNYSVMLFSQEKPNPSHWTRIPCSQKKHIARLTIRSNYNMLFETSQQQTMLRGTSSVKIILSGWKSRSW